MVPRGWDIGPKIPMGLSPRPSWSARSNGQFHIGQPLYIHTSLLSNLNCPSTNPITFFIDVWNTKNAQLSWNRFIEMSQFQKMQCSISQPCIFFPWWRYCTLYYMYFITVNGNIVQFLSYVYFYLVLAFLFEFLKFFMFQKHCPICLPEHSTMIPESACALLCSHRGRLLLLLLAAAAAASTHPIPSEYPKPGHDVATLLPPPPQHSRQQLWNKPFQDMELYRTHEWVQYKE